MLYILLVEGIVSSRIKISHKNKESGWDSSPPQRTVWSEKTSKSIIRSFAYLTCTYQII